MYCTQSILNINHIGDVTMTRNVGNTSNHICKENVTLFFHHQLQPVCSRSSIKFETLLTRLIVKMFERRLCCCQNRVVEPSTIKMKTKSSIKQALWDTHTTMTHEEAVCSPG